MSSVTYTKTINLDKIYEQYETDNKIFEKQFILLNHYMIKTSWPYSVIDYINDCKKLFNIDPFELSNFIYDNEKDLEKYLEKYNENFKRDLLFFSKNTYESLNNAWTGRNNPLIISSITITKKDNNESILSFTILDNKSFEFVIPSQQDFRSILTYLNKNYVGWVNE